MFVKSDKRYGFTMIELLVVIALMAILSAGVLYSISRARENGYAAKCRANLRNLAQGVLNLTTESDGQLPYAAGYEVFERKNASWSEHRGWVNWIPKDDGVDRTDTSRDTCYWPNMMANGFKSAMEQPPWYGARGVRGIKEGVLWAEYDADRRASIVGQLNMMDISSYICPRFKRKDVCGRTDAVRSYAMNDLVSGANIKKLEYNSDSNDAYTKAYKGKIQPASRTILFAEMIWPAKDDEPSGRYPRGANDDGDQRFSAMANRQIISKSERMEPNETIGFIHPMAGKMCGHVVFVDGHVEAAWIVDKDSTRINPSLELALGFELDDE